MSPPRVVSLIASATETVAALGCADWLVGRSHECDYPESIRRLPVCTAAKVDINANGTEIDRQIKSLLQQAASIYELDAETLDRLRPDIILTQSQCEVCAVSLRDVEQAVCELVASHPRVVAVEPNGLRDVWAGIQQIADALGVSSAGGKLVARLESRLDDLRRRAAGCERRPSVACIEWVDPLMAAGNWVPELVEIAGGVNLFGEAGRHSPWMTWEQLRKRDPDVIVVMPCGWDIPRSRDEMRPLVARHDWPALQAVQTGQVYLTDGNQYFNRPGPRVVESAEILAEILHPDVFQYGHEETGWTKFDATHVQS